MSNSMESRSDAREASYDTSRLDALRLGLVLVQISSRRYVVVNIGPSRLDAKYDPIPGGSVSQTEAAGRTHHYLRGSVVCGPAAYDECLIYIKDWLAARRAKT
ncbi:MAG: hypothetical protein U0746_18845 [Gemmataceae bacterium]